MRSRAGTNLSFVILAVTLPKRALPGSPTEYSDSFINKFNDLAVEPRTPQDPFRPPSPRRSPSTPDDISSTATTVPPPLHLPPITVSSLGRDYRPGRAFTSLPIVANSGLNLPTTSSIPIIPLAVQQHITKTIGNKRKSKARQIYNKTINKAWRCETCKVSCPNKATREAHLASRGHYLKNEYEKDKCRICNQTFFLPDDYLRHCQSKKHRRNI